MDRTVTPRRSVRSALGELDRPTPGVAGIAILALSLCVAFSTALMLSAWSPRFAILLSVAAVGALAVGRLLAIRDLAAWVAVGLLGWAALGGALSGNPRVALLGQLGKESSLLILGALIGLWALGRALPPTGEPFVRVAILVGLTLQALIAILQVLVQEEGELGLQSGRALGLTANPVYLGALMAGGAAFCACSALRDRGESVPWAWVCGVGVFAAVTNLTGSRIALASAGLVIVGVAVLERGRRVVHVLGAAATGVVAGELLSRALATSEVSGAGRSSVVGSGGRSALWSYGWDALLERPLVGWGLGRTRAAVQQHFTDEFVRNFAPSDTGGWFDAHNIVLEFAITTGLVGCALFVGFVFLAIRRARGPFLALFLGIALTWMLQPSSISTAPLAFLALGIAAPRGAIGDVNATRWMPIATRVTVALGALVGGYYLVADWRLAAAKDSAELSEVEDAARWLPPDAVIADLVAGAAALGIGDGVEPATLFEKSEDVVELESDRPLWWIRLGARHVVLGDDAAARAALEKAIALQPSNAEAWRLLEEVGIASGDEALETQAHARFCAILVESPACVAPTDASG